MRSICRPDAMEKTWAPADPPFIRQRRAETSLSKNLPKNSKKDYSKERKNKRHIKKLSLAEDEMSWANEINSLKQKLKLKSTCQRDNNGRAKTLPCEFDRHDLRKTTFCKGSVLHQAQARKVSLPSKFGGPHAKKCHSSLALSGMHQAINIRDKKLVEAFLAESEMPSESGRRDLDPQSKRRSLQHQIIYSNKQISSIDMRLISKMGEDSQLLARNCEGAKISDSASQFQKCELCYPEAIPQSTLLAQVTRIQRFWRSYCMRRITRRYGQLFRAASKKCAADPQPSVHSRISVDVSEEAHSFEEDADKLIKLIKIESISGSLQNSGGQSPINNRIRFSPSNCSESEASSFSSRLLDSIENYTITMQGPRKVQGELAEQIDDRPVEQLLSGHKKPPQADPHQPQKQIDPCNELSSGSEDDLGCQHNKNFDHSEVYQSSRDSTALVINYNVTKLYLELLIDTILAGRTDLSSRLLRNLEVNTGPPSLAVLKSQRLGQPNTYEQPDCCGPVPIEAHLAAFSRILEVVHTINDSSIYPGIPGPELQPMVLNLQHWCLALHACFGECLEEYRPTGTCPHYPWSLQPMFYRRLGPGLLPAVLDQCVQRLGDMFEYRLGGRPHQDGWDTMAMHMREWVEDQEVAFWGWENDKVGVAMDLGAWLQGVLIDEVTLIMKYGNDH